MPVRVERIASGALLCPAGQLDCATGPALLNTCTALVSRGVEHLVVDCADLDFIDCAGVTALVDLAIHMREVGGTAFLRNVPARMRWLLDALHVDLSGEAIDAVADGQPARHARRPSLN